MNDYERQLKHKKRKRKVLIIEIVILAVLAVVLGVSIWATQKFSLVKRSDIDETKLKTADAYNTTITPTAGPNPEISEDTDISITPVAAETSENQYVGEDLTGMDIIALVGLDTRLTIDDGENSDTMILCCINHNEKTLKLVSIYRDTLLNLGEYYDGTPNYYAKANEAYNIGGPTQFLSMINLNLDLNVSEYITVDFRALAYAIDVLGGLDVELTRQEIVHLNNYNVETAEVCGVPYEEVIIPDDESFDGVRTRSFHLNGTQSVSYARIRYTDGGDYRRASRQREVLRLVKEKAMAAGIGTIDTLLNTVLPYVTTNLDNSKLLTLATSVISYTFDQSEASGFPQVRMEDDGSITGTDCIIPVTLAYNVNQLHEYIFGADTGYVTSQTVLDYSKHIEELSGYGEESIEYVSTLDYGDAIVRWSEEFEQEQAASEEAASEEGTSEDYSDDQYSDDQYSDDQYSEEQYSEDQYYEEESY